MIVTTTPFVAGHRVTESKGQCFGLVVRSRGLAGNISAALRSRAGEVWLSESTDNGATWSPTKQLSPVNVHPADLCLLEDGRVLLTLGNRVGPFGVLGLVSDEEIFGALLDGRFQPGR